MRALLGFSTALALSLSLSTREASTPLPATTILIGDSILAGLEPQRCGGVVNLGRNSATSAYAMSVAASEITSPTKNAVILIGINDIAYGLPIATTARNILTSEAMLRSRGLLVTTIAPLRVTTRHDEAARFNARIAELRSAIPHALEMFLPDHAYSGDGVHLRPEGYRLLSDLLKSNGLCR